MTFDEITVNKPSVTVASEAVTKKPRIILDPNWVGGGLLHITFPGDNPLVVELGTADFSDAETATLEAFYNLVTAKAKAKIERA